MTQIASALLVTRDLFFSSQIEGLARSAGVTLQIVPRLPQLNSDLNCDLLILDLELPELDFEELAQQLDSQEFLTIGYGSHVKTHLFDEARKAGLAQLVPRGRLRDHLQQLFR